LRALHDQNHYEVLEVPRGAAPDQIERAYKIARETYTGNSLALYSVFGSRDASTIRERVEEAYRVLSHESTRAAYDAATAPDPDEVAGEATVDAPAPFEVEQVGEPRSLPDPLNSASDAFRDLEADVEEEGAGDFDGPMLRRARMRRGFDIDQISEITKVSPLNLRNLEEEKYEELPATVYVRGFLTAYARTIGIDPTRVVSSYIARVDSARAGANRGRFLGRR
jgi:flagellar biosynthesis protein FlhG